MKRFVVVEASPFPDVLLARCGNASFSVRLRQVHRLHSAWVIDEHLVVDVDSCRDRSLLDCADVLQGSRVHSATGALRRLAVLTSAYPSCGIAAVPLSDAGGVGGWALADGSDRSPVLVLHRLYGPRQDSSEQSLLPSCVHAWMVAGRSLREWPYAHEASAS
ncbi:hypothetical protein [Streptomyces pratensis]|uniref:hypothetical protein n=1 Tax=Streptomyces pratensis TaxID=1169025 RepID=UPI0019338A2D|nr:hypothetical protein [Streptomyces pratensis]